jgi:hypothetical protein
MGEGFTRYLEATISGLERMRSGPVEVRVGEVDG